LSNEINYFDNNAQLKLLIHLWSLSVEEQFYIFFPIIAWLSWKVRLNIFIILALFISLFLKINGVNNSLTGTYYMPYTRCWELLFGSLLANLEILFKNKPIATSIKVQKVKLNTTLASCMLSSAGLAFLIFGIIGLNKEISFVDGQEIIPVIGTLMIILAGQNNFINKFIISNNFLVYIGLISFPLYLVSFAFTFFFIN
jgi:peptidoglycan/LPS O-acetylase OafA/YrhL